MKAATIVRRDDRGKEYVVLTNGEVFAAGRALDALMTQDLPIKYAHELSLIRGPVADHVERIGKLREELLDKYAETDDKGNRKVSDRLGVLQWELTNEKEFNQKAAELMALEIKREWDPIPLDDLLEKASKIKISPAHVDLLMRAQVLTAKAATNGGEPGE